MPNCTRKTQRVPTFIVILAWQTRETREREGERLHRKSTDEPNDFSHKPKTTLYAREATCSDSGMPSTGLSCSSWQKGSHDIGYARSAVAIFGRDEEEGGDASLFLSLYDKTILREPSRRTGFPSRGQIDESFY